MQDAARFFKILADEARLQILWLLFNHRELCVCDIMAALEITQSKASRHLGALRHAELVTDRKDGLWTHYALRPVDDKLARRHLGALRTTLAGRPDAARLLAKLDEWLDARNQGVVCAKDAAGGATRKDRRTEARALPRRAISEGAASLASRTRGRRQGF
jgi:ArsR family transcriptional regulator, arsenate/arsenite/antimonite-responsive transcriptional repressor